jgi:hypothetical protein
MIRVEAKDNNKQKTHIFLWAKRATDMNPKFTDLFSLINNTEVCLFKRFTKP